MAEDRHPLADALFGRAKLTDKQKEIYANHLSSKGYHPNCQWCGQVQWIPSDHFVIPWIMLSNGRATLDNQPIIPLLLLTCGNCGNTMHFNAVVAKVYHAS